MKNLIHYYIGAVIFFVVLYGVQARASKGGGYTCGHVFNKTGSITNNTLHPDTECEYHIISVNNTVNILLQTLLLDAMDNVTITETNETEPLFPVFHGQEASVPLITDKKNVTITIAISSVKNITRHFELFYDTVTPDCSFVMHDEPKVQQPLCANGTGENIECKLIYNRKPNIAFSYSFSNFDLSQGSQVAITGVEEGPTTFTGQKRPPDLFATAQVNFDITLKSQNDTFVFQPHQLNAACSGYKTVSVAEKISSAPLPKLDNGSLITECRWFFKNDKNSLGFTLSTINLNSVFDMLVITDGQNFDLPPLHQITSATEKEALDDVIITSTENMIVSFKPSSLSSNFSATVYNAENGHLLLNNGTLTMMGPSKVNSTWLLQVDSNENVILNFNESSFKAPAVLHIYDDFSLKSHHIASVQGNVWYPLMSRTSRMMLVASGFGGQDTFKAVFHGSVAGCMHMSQGSSDSYVLSGNCNSSCSWIIPPINDKFSDLFVNLQYISLNSDDFIEVFRLDAGRTLVTNVTSNVTFVPQISFSASEGALVRVTRGTCAQKENAIVLVAQSHYLPKCSGTITMTPYNSVQLTSPNFPNTYPVLAICNWTLTSSPSKQLIHIAFDELQLAPNHCVVITGNGTAPTILTGYSVPDAFFFKTDVLVEFNSKGCDPKIKNNPMVSSKGFSLNATSTDCGDILTAEKGQFTTPANKSLCIWKISIPPTTGDSVNIIIFSVKPKDKTGNYKLDIYDGASVRSPMITNTSDTELWSRINTLIIVYKPINMSAAASEVTISYKTLSCNQSMQCDNKICLHADWRCNGHNDCGDFSDERDCQPVPVVPKPVNKGGISPVVFGVVIVLMFCAGVILAVFVPKLKNFRSQYRQFRDVSVID